MISTSKTAVRLLACAGALGLALPAAAAAFAAPRSPSPIAGVCQAVMGLEPGQAQFDGCTQSLGGSVHDIGGARALVDARQACLDRGLKIGTPALAVCTVQGGGAAAPARSPMLVDASAAPAATRSWFSVSNSEQRRRERLACASLGLDPTSGAFDSCVAGLAATLFELDNPST